MNATAGARELLLHEKHLMTEEIPFNLLRGEIFFHFVVISAYTQWPKIHTHAQTALAV